MTTRVYLLGHGVSYSSSPAMHNAAFHALGLDWRYDVVDAPAAELGGALALVRQADAGGANVTIPHKQSVLEHLDVIDDEAMRARAVNTIVNRGGRLAGYNTDVAAIRRAAGELRVDGAGANVVILGAGGAARAAAQALAGAHLTFVARRPDEVDVPGRTLAWDDPAVARATRAADLLVNATPLGRRDEMPLRPAAMPVHGALIDLVYVTGGTPLVHKARSFRIPTVDGWSILLWQGAAAFELWTGKSAPVDVMRQTLRP